MANGMGSLFIGHSGLIASRDAINNVANNLANVNTEGYVRQQVVFRDTDYTNIAYAKNGNKKLTGLGTSIGELVHARDIFLDKAYRKDNGKHSYYQATFEAVDEVQTLFQELEGTAFQEILTGETSLWHSFQELSKDPSGMVYQNLVIQKSSLFASRAQAVFKGLMNYQENINVQISEDIDKINKYIKKIYDLNIQIQSIEAGGRETAMNERDARDYALDQLSGLGNITYNEEANGTVTLKFEGTQVVDSMFYYEMGKQTDRLTGYITPYWPHLSNEEGGRYQEVFDFTQEICDEYDTDIGELKALVQARGTGIANFNDILNANADEYDATIGLSIMQNTQAEFDQLVHGIVKQINDILAKNKTMDSLVVKNEDGTYSEYRNVEVLDEENCLVGADGKKPPQELFTRTGCSRYREVTGVDLATGEEKTYYLYNVEDVNDSMEHHANGKTYHIYDTDHNTTVTTFVLDAAGNRRILTSNVPYTPWDKEGNVKYKQEMINGAAVYVLNENYLYDTSKQYTTMEINVNQNLKEQVTNLPHINKEMEIDQSIALKLANIWDEKTLHINPRYLNTGYTFDEYYREMIGEIAIIGSAYESTADNLEEAVAAVENQRMGVIGVSSDEELTRMIKYQNAYNASSRYIQTISDMIEMLVTSL